MRQASCFESIVCICISLLVTVFGRHGNIINQSSSASNIRTMLAHAAVFSDVQDAATFPAEDKILVRVIVRVFNCDKVWAGNFYHVWSRRAGGAVCRSVCGGGWVWTWHVLRSGHCHDCQGEKKEKRERERGEKEEKGEMWLIALRFI